MAPPVKQAPATLPADFFDKQQGGSAATLPADFKFEAPASSDLYTAPPEPPKQPLAQRALGFGEDLGKGALESLGGAAYTLGAPVAWAAHKMGMAQETPEQKQQQENLFKPVNATQAVGAGAGDAAQAMFPIERALPIVGKLGRVIGDAAEPVINKVSEFNQAWNPLPLKSRAVKAMKLIEMQAKDVPVNMENTQPAVDVYRQHVATAGEPSSAMNTLEARLNNPTKGPVKFPEARDFYKNVGRDAQRPGILRRMMEPSGMADTRRVVGGAGQALKTDIGNAANTIGRGEDLATAMNEYRHNANLRTLGKVFAGIAAEETARRTGMLGKVARKVIGQ